MPREKGTLNEDIFAREYYKTNNALQSAIKAGWTKSTAISRAHKLLDKVGIKNKIRKLEEKAKEKFEISEERIMNELVKTGFANVQDFMTWTEKGEVVFKPSTELSRDTAAAISGISVSTKFDKDGNQLGVDAQLKMNDKLKALEMMGRKIGMWNDKLTVTKKVINVNLDDSDTDDDD